MFLGLLSAFAFPPCYATSILWVIYPLLLWQLDGAGSHRKACLIGWGFGFGQFVLGFYWISVSMFTDIAHWWWAVPFASTILPILLGFIPGFVLMMWWRLRLTGLPRILAFAAWMMVGEWFRGHFLTGFPWNLTAHTWIGWGPVLQSFSIFGAYGLGLLTLIAASMPSLLGNSLYPAHRSLGFTAGGICVFAALAAWGAWRVPAGPMPTVPGVTLRLVQPNISQSEKWSPLLLKRNFNALLALSQEPPKQDVPSVIVWPETAVPYSLDLYPEVAQVIGALPPPQGMALVGHLRREGHSRLWAYFNSLEVVDHDGNRLAHYDKTHLAPFGEYMPFRNVLPLDALAVGGSDLSAGDGAHTLTAPGLPLFSPLICYEAIFPERVVQADTHPEWLLQITNDGWFGTSWGPHQHFAMARARAVENGLPLIRDANTGITAAIDPYGRIVSRLPIATSGILDVKLPRALEQRPFYGRWGDAAFAAMLLMVVIVCMKTSFRT